MSDTTPGPGTPGAPGGPGGPGGANQQAAGPGSAGPQDQRPYGYPPPPGYAPTELSQGPAIPGQPGGPQQAAPQGQQQAAPQGQQQPGGLPPQQSGWAYAPTQASPQAQPPQQGYGYPGAGPQGGYAPTPPPGWPQQQGQPQPPQAQPEFQPGYPQQGQPGYPGQQPQSGYPYPPQGQPGYPQQPGGAYPMGGYPGRQGGGRKLHAGWITGLVAAGVLVVAIVVLAFTVFGGGGGGGGKGGAAMTKDWSVPSGGESDQLVGSWLTDKLLVRASSGQGVTAYNLDGGTKAWTVTPPSSGGGNVPCAMSPTLSDKGIGTIAFGTDSHSCTVMTGVDASTGKVLWSIPLTNSEHSTAMSAQTYIQGDVATIVGATVLGGVKVDSGTTVWGYHARGDYCNVYDYGAPGVVLVDDYCADRDSEPYTLTAYDGATGKQLWRKDTKDHTDVRDVYAASPIVASLSETGNDSVVQFDASGNSKKLSTGNLELSVGNSVSDDRVARLVNGGKTLVVPTRGGSDDISSVTAYDLGTGNKLWSYDGESHHGAALADDNGDGKLYAVSTGSYSGVPHVVTLDPATGTSTVLSELPTGTDGWTFTYGTVYVLPDGRLVVLNDTSLGGGAVVAYKKK